MKILCLTYGKLKTLTASAALKLAHEPIELFSLDGLAEDIQGEIEALIHREGIDALVAGGSNAAFARRRFDLPMVRLRTAAFDYVQAMLRARHLGRRAAIVVVEGERLPDLLEIGRMLDLELEVTQYCTGDSLEELIGAVAAEAVIGAGHAAQVADQLGKTSILIYPGEETVTEAILEANKLVKEMRRERERSELTNALIRSTPNSLVIIDESGQIIEFNPEAEKVYGKSALVVKGKRPGQVLEGCTLEALLVRPPDGESVIRNIRDRLYLEKTIRIFQEKRVTGAIEILAELSDIRHAEHRYSQEQKKKNMQKGFLAKSTFSQIIGASPPIREAISEAELFARADASILLRGESGTGKELFAQSIHNHSARAGGPFIAINCAALPESLLESELFGYEEGAFTGSKKGGKMGIFELANGGTIFLDEVGELFLPLQARLLRVLQEREVMRVGGERLYPIDVRVIAATNKDIYHMGDKLFRRDLLYRLQVLELSIPPLRRRGKDVLNLFLAFFRQRLSTLEYGPELPKSPLDLLTAYTWPGNVRELQNVCERFCIYLRQNPMADERTLRRYMVRSIGEERFLEDVLLQFDYDPIRRSENPEGLKKLVAHLKKCFDYNNEQVSAALGISRTTLWRLEK